MRYAAMNQTLDVLGDYGGFVPDAQDGQTRAAPGKAGFSGARDRYSDAQLYALGEVPVLADAAAQSQPAERSQPARRAGVRARAAARRCHTPPAYTANALVPADGFTVPPEHRRRYDVLDVRVGTDPTLAMRTRRGTGYYKIPSLRGVWYRGPFEHSGSVATLEDWFDAGRLRGDYVPTGFEGAGVDDPCRARASVRPRAVSGRQGGAHRVPEDAVAGSRGAQCVSSRSASATVVRADVGKPHVAGLGQHAVAPEVIWPGRGGR